MNAHHVYTTYRPLLFSLAYRLLGSVVEAEDVVQETFLAWNEREADADHREPVQNLRSFLCRIAAHKCADRIHTLQRRRETYIGPWLPEPLVDGTGTPEDVAVQRASLHTAYILLLQNLSAVERIVFVLREAFGFEYGEIADIVDKRISNCRQIVHRARRRLALAGDTQTEQRMAEAHGLATQFARAIEAGDVDQVMALLSPNAQLITDGGGKVKAAPVPIHTPKRIAAFLTGVLSNMPEGTTVNARLVNGLPGWVFSVDGTVIHVISLALDGQHITRLHVVSNPDKLAHLNRPRRR